MSRAHAGKGARRRKGVAVLFGTLALLGSGLAAAATPPAGRSFSTADHSRFAELQGPFKSGEEVTQACLQCHTEAAKQVMATRHWTWDYAHPQTGQRLGKKNMVNGFCIGIASNEAFCTSCHAGYG